MIKVTSLRTRNSSSLSVLIKRCGPFHQLHRRPRAFVVEEKRNEYLTRKCEKRSGGGGWKFGWQSAHTSQRSLRIARLPESGRCRVSHGATPLAKGVEGFSTRMYETLWFTHRATVQSFPLNSAAVRQRPNDD